MSGVYIKDRKPPNSCDDCWVSDCPNDEHIDGYRMMDRPTYCPLIPIHGHWRLIDADEAIGHLFNGEQCLYCWDEIEDAIDATATIIPADKEDGE